MMPAMISPTDTRLSWQERGARALQTLQTWPWLDTLKTLRQRFREDRLGLTASSLTFTTLISLVPLFTVMLAVFSAFPMFSSFQDALQKYFLQSLVPDSIAKPVLAALTQFSVKAHRIGTLGLVFLVLTALALMLTIDRTLNAIWRVRTPRPIARRVLVYWAAATLGPLVLGVSLSLTSYALSASRGLVGAIPGGLSLLLDTLEFTLFAAAMAGLFHYVPNTHVRWRHAIAGGVFVSAGFEVAKKALSWYLTQVPTYAVVYGAFATVPILLIWIYLGWVIVLLGAVIAAYAPSLQLRVKRWPHAPGSRFHLAVELLRELARAQRQQRPGLTASQLAEGMRIDPLQTEPILATLAEIDWIGRLDEAGDARYVLLCDPEHTPVQPLVARLLMEPVPSLRPFWQRAGFADITLNELLSS
jgi:membrane protein